MSKPLVSIIIPTYNYGHLIRQTLESVSAQVWKDWECIVVDDGSTDDTYEVVSEFISSQKPQDYTYVKILNSGTSEAKNTGIDLSKGRYIQFLDADDLLSKNKISTQVKILEEQDCAMVFCKSVFFTNHNGKNIYSNKYPYGFLAQQTFSGFNLLQRLVRNNIITISSPLVHTSLLKEAGKFKPDLKNNEDWLLWFKIALLKPHFIFDGEEGSAAEIRIHLKSAINNSHQMFLGEVAVRQEIAGAFKNLPHSADIQKLEQFNSDLLALHQTRSLEIIKGMKYILTKFVKNPFGNFMLLGKGCLRLAIRIFKK